MTLFYRSPSHTATRSYLVELAQIALEAQNCPTGGTDGVFGKGTEDAVRRWQIANGFDETGVITLPERVPERPKPCGIWPSGCWK